MRKYAELLFLALLILIGAGLRLSLLTSLNFVIDGDEAIVGLMAKHIVEGQPLPTFYYGQHYMGSFEPLVVAAVFNFFGASCAALKLVPFTFSLLLIPLVYELGRLCAGLPAARLAGLFTAVAPSTLIEWSSKARGGFIELVCLGTGALVLALHWQRAARPDQVRTFVIGLLLGFGWWTNNQIIYFMLPVALALLLGCRDLAKRNKQRLFALLSTTAMIGVIGFLVGGAPFWIYNFTHDFASFGIFGRARLKDLDEHITGLFGEALPILLGARRFWQEIDLFPYATLLAYLLYVGLLLGLWLKTKLARSLQTIWILIFFCLTCGGVFVCSSFGWLSQAPRYLLPMYAGIFPLAASAVVAWYRYYAPLGVLSGLAVIALNLASNFLGGQALPGEPIVYNGERVARSHIELIEWLKQQHVSWVRTNYWIGYRLAFETNEAVRFTMFQAPHETRIKEYEEIGQTIPLNERPLILVPSQSAIVERGLKASGHNFERSDVGGYAILWNIRASSSVGPPLPAQLLRVSSGNNPDQVNYAIDGDLNSRWGSGEPQRPGVEFVIALTEPRKLVAIDYVLAGWWTDYPRKLELELESPGGERTHVLDDSVMRSVLYALDSDNDFSIVFPPRLVSKVILRQMGRDPKFDWSIAELRLHPAASEPIR